MNSIETRQIKDLARYLDTAFADRTVACANMLRQMAGEMGVQRDSPEYGTLVQITGRIWDLLPGADLPAYSMHDCADGIANARGALDLNKLLALDDDSFIAAIAWLAEDKRETYTEKGHFQEPLELDIYTEPAAGA